MGQRTVAVGDDLTLPGNIKVLLGNLPAGTNLVTGLANNAKLDTDAPSTYPLGVSYFSTTSNGFGVNFGVVTTVRTGIASRSTQTVLQSSANLQLFRVETAGDTWSAWATLATTAVATGSVAGLMSAGDKTSYDARTISSTPSTIMTRDTNGTTNVAAPTIGSHPTTKTYVDTALGLKADKTYVDTQFATAPIGAIAKLANATLSAGINTTETLLLELTGVSLIANHNYLIKVSLDAQGVTAGAVGITATIKYGGTAASANGNVAEAKTVWTAPVQTLNQSTSIVILYTPTATTTQRFKLTGVRVSGTSDFKIAACDMAIFDMGTQVVP